MDRSWGVAGAASITAFFTVVMMMNSGFFYVSFIEEFGVARESGLMAHKRHVDRVSLISSVNCSHSLLDYTLTSGYSVLRRSPLLQACLVSWFQRHLSVFILGLIGSIFLWTGILGAFFAPDITWMTVTLGAIHGECPTAWA
ncbi:hypothetical protein MTO96_017773 [Rhipicephalus appendiculatus]